MCSYFIHSPADDLERMRDASSDLGPVHRRTTTSLCLILHCTFEPLCLPMCVYCCACRVSAHTRYRPMLADRSRLKLLPRGRYRKTPIAKQMCNVGVVPRWSHLLRCMVAARLICSTTLELKNRRCSDQCLNTRLSNTPIVAKKQKMQSNGKYL